MDALSFNLCFDTTSMAHRDAVRGERHPLLLGPIRSTHALVPQLLLQPAARMITVSSGLAFVPLAMTPTYSATKAAIRSWTRSLRTQMAGTRIRVHELAPPAVQTGLMPGRRASPHAMPFDAFLDEVMRIWLWTRSLTRFWSSGQAFCARPKRAAPVLRFSTC